MAKFCGKCGSQLNEDGSCPKCNAAQNTGDNNEINKRETGGAVPNNSAPEKPVKLTHKEKKTAKKVERKRRKKEKRAAMSFGQKTKHFFLKLLALFLALAILAGSVSCALVYFDIADIPFIEKVMGLFGYEKEEPEESHFASIPGKFTDEKITNADEAIKAAQNAASQLGLQTATDELTLLKEDTVGELTYYRLQQNYQGIPVYGKTIVVVADKNGEAKSINSNAYEIKGINTPQVYVDDTIITKSIKSFFADEKQLTDIDFVVESAEKDKIVIYVASNVPIFCYKLIISSNYGIFDCFISCEKGEVVFLNSAIMSNQARFTESGQEKEQTFIAEKGSDNNSMTYVSSTGTEINIYTPKSNHKYDWYSNNCADLVTWKNGNKPDKSAVDTMTNLSIVYNYFLQQFARDSYDGNQTNINAYVHIEGYKNYSNQDVDYINNAFHWISPNGHVMAITKRFDKQDTTKALNEYSTDLDIIGHEFTHGVVSETCALENTAENYMPAAINEAVADIMGYCIEAQTNRQPIDWVIRSIRAAYPGATESDGFLYSMDDYETSITEEHTLSTIISYAAYLMNNGVNGERTALEISDIQSLWYHSLLLFPSDCTFSNVRNVVIDSADIIGLSNDKKDCVKAAFDEVGISENDDDGFKYDTHSELKVLDKNNIAYDDYTIVIDGKEFNGWFKWGWVKKDYHKEISVDSAEPYELNLPKGDYTITIIDNFSGNKTYSKSIKARDDQDLKDIEFATAFGFDYNVNSNPELQVKDVNVALYDNYTAIIKGKNESGTEYSKTITVDKPEAPVLDLETGKYSFLLTDNADKSKTKSFSVRVRLDAPTSVIQIKTAFGKPYGEFDKSDLPSGVREFNGHYYYIYNVPEITTWEQAQEYCRSRNGYLATLTTREENSFAYSLLNNFNVAGAYFGLRDAGYNNWQWVNNETFSYSNWAYGEPNSYSEPYGMFHEQYVETWNDGDFGNYTSEDRAFICEWGAYEVNSEQVPETPTQRTTSGERDVVLCLDMSGSMAGNKLQQTKEASIKFINTVLQEDASIAIVTYDDSARVLSDFSTNAEELISKINEISDGGSTNIEDGLVKSYDLLNYSNAKKQIIVLMSDGEPNEGKVGEELISYADSIKNEGVYIYTLGFFGGYSGQSAAQTLMERIASEGCHYEVSDADSLVFFFGDIADTINGQEYIYIRIACPVDVKVSYNGETLNSNEENLSTRTSFGSLTFEENTSEYSEDDVDDRVKVLRLKADDDYDISIEGTGRGRMNYTIGFMDENGEYSDFRKFTNIKIRKSTVIDTVAAKSKNTILNVDEDGDGKYDLKYKAGANERGKIVDYSYIFYIAFVVIGLTAVLIVFLVVRKKMKTRKRGV